MLVSVHIPKTGGVTLIRSVLRPAFGERLLLDYGDKPLARPAAERNEAARAFEPDPTLPDEYDCAHGHFLAVKYVSERVPCKFACWFRDPVQRMASRFHYGKRIARGLVTPQMTLAEFAQIEKFHDTYAQYLWGFDLAQFDFIGITEDYANSVRTFARQFGLPEQPLANVNVNPAKGSADQYEIDKDTRDLILRTNLEDVDIYAKARSINKSLQRRYL